MAHPLDGARAKIDRAVESVEYLNRDITGFFSGRYSTPNKIVGKPERNGLEYAFVVSGDPEVPLRFSVKAGEIIYLLRSSLDHLVHALVVQNGGAPTNQTQFPICTTIEKFDEARKRRRIEGVSASAEKLIIAKQPYTSPVPDDTVLAVLDEYNRFDKHQLLIVCIAVAQIRGHIAIRANERVNGRQITIPDIVDFSDLKPRKMSEDGNVIFTLFLKEAAPDLQVEAEFMPQIAFEKCGRKQLAPIIDVLHGFISATKDILRSFDGEFV